MTISIESITWLQQILQWGKGRFVLMGTMPAVTDVEVLAADGAEPFAVGTAKRADGYLEEGVLADDGLKIYLRIFRDQQSGLAQRFLGERVQLGHFPMQLLVGRLEATGTLQRGTAGKIAGDQKALGRAAYLYKAAEVVQLKIVTDLELGKLKRKFCYEADFLVNDEADVNSEGTARIAHVNLN